MWYIYILQSVSYPDRFYTGFTNNLKRRLEEHNSNNNSGHTLKYKPWELHTYLGFKDKELAMNFEKYLKTQAGRRFQKTRFQEKQK